MISKTFYQLADELHAELVRHYGGEGILTTEYYATAINDAIRATNELIATFEEVDRKIKSGEIVIIDGRLERFIEWIKAQLTSN